MTNVIWTLIWILLFSIEAACCIAAVAFHAWNDDLAAVYYLVFAIYLNHLRKETQLW